MSASGGLRGEQHRQHRIRLIGSAEREREVPVKTKMKDEYIKKRNCLRLLRHTLKWLYWRAILFFAQARLTPLPWLQKYYKQDHKDPLGHHRRLRRLWRLLIWSSSDGRRSSSCQQFIVSFLHLSSLSFASFCCCKSQLTPWGKEQAKVKSDIPW